MEVQSRLKLEIFCSTLHGNSRSNIFNVEVTDSLEIAEIFVGTLIGAEWHGVPLLGPSITSVDLMDMFVSFVQVPVIASATRPSSRILHSFDPTPPPSLQFHHSGDLYLYPSLDMRPSVSILLHSSCLDQARGCT